MDTSHRRKLLKLRSECVSFASKFNKKCEDFFKKNSMNSSNITEYYNTIQDMKIKTYDDFFEDAKISKNACKSINKVIFSIINDVFPQGEFVYYAYCELYSVEQV